MEEPEVEGYSSYAVGEEFSILDLLANIEPYLQGVGGDAVRPCM